MPSNEITELPDQSDLQIGALVLSMGDHIVVVRNGSSRIRLQFVDVIVTNTSTRM